MIVEAYHRYATAESYLLAATLVYAHPDRYEGDREVGTELPINMLVGFATELYLKAYLLSKGCLSSSVKGHGHRLDELLNEANKIGLLASEGLTVLIELIGKDHQDYTFRYADEGDTIYKIDWKLAFAILDELDDQVHDAVAATIEGGKVPRLPNLAPKT